MTNPDDEIRRHPRTIEQDFEGLFRTMRSKRFRNGEDTGGEPANYIYAYPPEQELEVERRIPMLVNRLQSMDPVDSNDSAPGVLVIDLYKTVSTSCRATTSSNRSSGSGSRNARRRKCR